MEVINLDKVYSSADATESDFEFEDYEEYEDYTEADWTVRVVEPVYEDQLNMIIVALGVIAGMMFLRNIWGK